MCQRLVREGEYAVGPTRLTVCSLGYHELCTYEFRLLALRKNDWPYAFYRAAYLHFPPFQCHAIRLTAEVGYHKLRAEHFDSSALTFDDERVSRIVPDIKQRFTVDCHVSMTI